jgi:hypothetical protein
MLQHLFEVVGFVSSGVKQTEARREWSQLAMNVSMLSLGSGSFTTGNSLAILAFLVLPSRGETTPRA